MNKLLLCVSFIFIISIDSLSFYIDRDSIDYTDKSNYIFLVNNSSDQVIIDSIKIYCSDDLISDPPLFLQFSVLKDFGHVAYSIKHLSDSLYLAIFSWNTGETIINGNIYINSNDSLEIRRLNLNTLYSGLAKKNSCQDTSYLKLVFVCSNGDKDSITVNALVKYCSAITNPLKRPHKIKNTTNNNSYLLNGKIINKDNVLNVKPHNTLKIRH